MGFYIAILTTALVVMATTTKGRIYNTHCNARDVTKEYRAAIDDFVIWTYKKGAALNKFHTAFAPQAMWITLSAIAEGADPDTQKDLFKLLGLPDDQCTRQQYYKVATSRLLPGNDLHIASTRALVIDVGVTINSDWHDFVSENNLLDVISAPIKTNPKVALREMQRIVSANLTNLNMSGNSVILEAFDYNGLWNTAFHEATVKRAPFYAPNGQRVGSVDLMKITKHVRMGYSQNLQAKTMELTVGADSRYRILFALIIGDGDPLKIIDTLKGSVVKEVEDSLQDSAIPIVVAIPRFEFTTEFNTREMLESLGVNSLWNDETATRFTNPSALPSSYVQRMAVSLDSAGVHPTPIAQEIPADAFTGLDPRVGREFIANKPFLMGIYDRETHTNIVSVIFSKPTYSD